MAVPDAASLEGPVSALNSRSVETSGHGPKRPRHHLDGRSASEPPTSTA